MTQPTTNATSGTTTNATSEKNTNATSETNTRNSAPTIEGWFTRGDAPCLIGTRCKRCGTYFFPRQELFCRNPDCRSREFDEVELSRRGRIWSYTKHYYPPPEPYIASDPFEPYTIAAVELEREKMVILGQVARGYEPEDLHTGQEMEVVVETLYQQNGTDYTVWKWKPVSTGGRTGETR